MLTSDALPTPRRRPWLAAALSLLGGPIGQIYAGALGRSAVLWTIGVAISAAFLFCCVTFRVAGIAFVLLATPVFAYPIVLAIDAWRVARRNRNLTAKRYQRWWFYVIALLFVWTSNYIVALLLRTFVAEPFVVPTRGMAPTILAGDKIIVDKLWCSPNRLRRGDIVVFRSEGPNSPLFVMRVAAIPGDRIEIKEEQVFVNGEKSDDNYAVFDETLPPYPEMRNMKSQEVPLQSLFLLGDNRRRSLDSRFRGPVPLSDLHGTARLIYWSQPRHFPDLDDTRHYVRGPVRWDRTGLRLDCVHCPTASTAKLPNK